MKFSFRNLGMIQDAEIEVNGLTILTGYNDSGKSSLSKTIYGIIKTITEYEKNADYKKYETASTIARQIFSLHRQNILFTQEKLQRFGPEFLSTRISDSIIQKKIDLTELVKIVDDYCTKVIEDLKDPSNPYKSRINDKLISQITHLTKQLIYSINEDIDDEQKLKMYFDEQIIQGQFQGQINDVSNEETNLEIIVSEGVTELLHISVLKNKSHNFKINSPIFLKEAIIIETPTIVQLERFIINSLAFSPFQRQRGDLPPYYVDLFKRIRFSLPAGASTYSNILQEIKKIIGGEIKFKEDEGGIVFNKSNGSSIRSFNIASGVKSFGLIQLLIACGAVNQNSILIVDEPEVHLHPTWEIEYARIITLLSKANVPIIISTHSPYFIKALTVFQKKYELPEEKVRVYFAEKDGSGVHTNFKNITSDMSTFLDTLATPMQNLMMES